MEADLLTSYERTSVRPEKITFNVSSTTPWTITKSDAAEWCKITPTSSAMSSLSTQVTIELEENMSSEDRAVSIILAGEGLEKTYKADIKQGRHSSFFVQPIDEVLPKEGGKATFTVTSNYAWTVLAENQWLELDVTSGEGTGKSQVVTATAKPNNGARRSTNVVITDELGNVKKFEVSQNGMVLKFVGVENNTVRYNATGETRKFEVSAGEIDWKVVCDDECVSINKLNSSEVEIKVRGNNLFAQKTIDVVLRPVDPELSGLLEGHLTITQDVQYREQKGTIKINQKDGSAFLTTVNGISRFVTGEYCKFGTYIWKFQDANLGSEAYVDLNFWPDNGGAKMHYYFGADNEMDAGGSKVSETTGKNVDYSASASLAITPEMIASLTEIKLVMTPITVSQMKIEAFVNGTSVGSMEMPHIWYHHPNHELPCYFGIDSNNSAVGTIIMKSFDFIPYGE